MDAIWYYLEAGQERGPVTLEELAATLRATPDPQGAYVWQEGMAEWQTAGSVPEVRRRLQVQPPAPEPPRPVLAPPPLLPPTAAPAPHAPRDFSGGPKLPLDQAEAIAKQYRRLVTLVGLQLLLGCLIRVPVAAAAGAEPSLGASLFLLGLALVYLVIVVALVGSAYRLASHLGEGVPVLWAAAMFLPCINIIVLLVLSSKAQAWCRQYGIQVGLLGPTKQSIEELRRNRWGSEFD